MPATPIQGFVSIAMVCGLSMAQAQTRPAVVELYTSEGCSSCPPAEAYAGELARRPDVLVLSFHVDYWDDLGWRDRFGLPESVRRQRAYARTLRLSSMYTPQVVLDGREDFLGSDRSGIGRALSGHRSGVAIALTAHAGAIQIELSPQAAAPCDVVLVSYTRTAVSPIGRGENAGRTLKESNIVRGLRILGTWRGEAQGYEVRAADLPSDATDVAVLVQPLGQAPIIGAATVALREP